jgi:metal-sulfur cluster biosynthetic enzyme
MATDTPGCPIGGAVIDDARSLVGPRPEDTVREVESVSVSLWQQACCSPESTELLQRRTVRFR